MNALPCGCLYSYSSLRYIEWIRYLMVVYTGTVHYDTLNECVTLWLSILVQFVTIHWMNALPCGCLYSYSSLRYIEWIRYLVVVYTGTVHYDTLNECVTLWLSILVQFITIRWMNALPCGCMYWYSSLRYVEWIRYLVVVYTGTVHYDTLNECVTLWLSLLVQFVTIHWMNTLPYGSLYWYSSLRYLRLSILVQFITIRWMNTLPCGCLYWYSSLRYIEWIRYLMVVYTGTVHYDTLNECVTLWLSILVQFTTIHWMNTLPCGCLYWYSSLRYIEWIRYLMVVYTGTVHYDTLNECVTLWLSILVQFTTIHWMNTLPCGCLYWYSSLRYIEWILYLMVVYTGIVHYGTLNEYVTLWLSILVQFVTIRWMNTLPYGCLYSYSSLRYVGWIRYLMVVYTGTVHYDTLNEYVTLWLSILVQFITIHWMNTLPCGCLYSYSSLRYIEWIRYLMVVYNGTVHYDTLNECVTLWLSKLVQFVTIHWMNTLPCGCLYWYSSLRYIEWIRYLVVVYTGTVHYDTLNEYFTLWLSILVQFITIRWMNTLPYGCLYWYSSLRYIEWIHYLVVVYTGIVHYDTLNEYVTFWLSILVQFTTIHWMNTLPCCCLYWYSSLRYIEWIHYLVVVYTGIVHYDTLNEYVTLWLSILVQFITIHWMNTLPCCCLYWYSSLRYIEWIRYLLVVYTGTVHYDTLNEYVTLL